MKLRMGRRARRVCRTGVIGVVVSVLAAPGVAAAGSGDVGWRYYGNDLANTRYQNLDQVTLSNASQLKPIWEFHTGVTDKNASFEDSPLVVGGTMYATTGHDDVYALDPATGAEKWAYHPESDMPPLKKIAICCGQDNRGVAYGDGMVYLARLDGILVALDAHTGAVRWKMQVADWHQGYALTMAPQYADGRVMVGVSGGEYKVRGRLDVYDAATGKQAWVFHTTLPGKTWAGDSWQSGGGPIWTTPPVDEKRGLVYVNTGNAAPDVYGADRAGKNLHTASIVALDIRSGQVKWAYQQTHHDIWDYDSAQPSVLFDVQKNGETIPALGECSKNGYYYILDRDTGSTVYPAPETTVPTQPAWQNPWPTQPESTVESLTPHTVLPGTVPSKYLTAPQYTPPSKQSPVIVPGDNGGCEWPSAAYSPRTHDVYYGARYEPSFYTSHPGNANSTASAGRGAPDHQLLGSSFSDLPGATDFGIFGATNVDTGKVTWRIKVAQPAKSGLLVAGDLAFFGESNGTFHAVNAATGAKLWAFDGTSIPHGGGANGQPIAYRSGGREFIANPFGGNVADKHLGSVNGDALVAFALPMPGYSGPHVVFGHPSGGVAAGGGSTSGLQDTGLLALGLALLAGAAVGFRKWQTICG